MLRKLVARVALVKLLTAISCFHFCVRAGAEPFVLSATNGSPFLVIVANVVRCSLISPLGVRVKGGSMGLICVPGDGSS